ncbi:hypothetical protein C8J56DRAFT_1065056 [Mycena floridula]|nr:hypothetical protein C8J56DRAFT_1065056 [Mycena floridula]
MQEATPPQHPPTGPQSRRHTQPLVQKENEDLARQLCAAQKNAKQLKKQLKGSQQGHRPRGTTNRQMSDSDDEADIESQDEEDQAGSRRSGGGFTSAIQSQGILETSHPPAPRKLYQEGRPPQTEVLSFRPVANIQL